MTHQGLPVAGYKAQTDDKVALVNRNKEIEERFLRIIDDLMGTDGVDRRWLSIGRTHIEQGFMAVNRAVFQPGRAELPYYTEGVCADGAAILKDGVPMTASEIVEALNGRGD